MTRPRLQLLLIAAAVLLAMAPWFSAAAVIPQWRDAGLVGEAALGWLTAAVQLGFVAGSLLSALLGLPDRWPAQRLLAGSALLAAVANAGILGRADDAVAVVGLRAATGFALAGVYAPGMRLVASWTGRDRGLGLGILVAALAVGSSLPHLVGGLAGAGAAEIAPWPRVIAGTSAAAAAAALLAGLLVRAGPLGASPAPFDWRAAGVVWRDRAARLALGSYLGHMWELYALWAWAPLFLLISYEAAGWSPAAAGLAGCGVVAAGAAGSVAAGWLADRAGRTAVAAGCLAVSGACALAAGFLGQWPLAATAVCLLWGAAALADSAQYSAALTELVEARHVGTALTVQTGAGFLLTSLSIQVIARLVPVVGWGWAFAALAPGPLLGILGLAALRRRPEAARLAAGRR